MAKLPINQGMWTLFVLIVFAIALGGSVIIAFLKSLLLLILSFILLIILIIGVIWFIKNEMNGGRL